MGSIQTASELQPAINIYGLNPEQTVPEETGNNDRTCIIVISSSDGSMAGVGVSSPPPPPPHLDGQYTRARRRDDDEKHDRKQGQDQGQLRSKDTQGDGGRHDRLTITGENRGTDKAHFHIYMHVHVFTTQTRTHARTHSSGNTGTIHFTGMTNIYCTLLR